MNIQTQAEIKELLLEKANLEIRMSNICKRPIDYDERVRHFGLNREIVHNDLVQDINKYYRQIFGWIKANPSEHGLAEAIKSVYIWCNENTVNTPVRTANTKAGHKAFLKQITDKSTNTIILIGKKGSGKTFYLNYLLNTETRNLEKERIIWYRVDATKVFENNLISKYLSLTDYLCLQIAYVSLKYRKNTPIWDKIFQENNPEFIEEVINVCNERVSLKEGLPRDFTKIVKDYQHMIEQIKSKRDSDLTKDDIRSIMQDPKRQAQCEIVSRSIISYMVKQNYRPLFIIDSIDNIDFFYHEEIYLKFIKELIDFTLRDDKQEHEYNALHVVVMRDETYSHLRSMVQTKWVDEVVPFYIGILGAEQIINIKHSAATNTINEYFRNIKNSLNIALRIESILKDDPNFPFKNQEDFDKQFSTFINEYMSDVIKHHEILTEGTTYSLKNLDEINQYIFTFLSKIGFQGKW